jgi:Ran GTPase-activating protein (RanGAP) involved in mRNA processing and transport
MKFFRAGQIALVAALACVAPLSVDADANAKGSPICYEGDLRQTKEEAVCAAEGECEGADEGNNAETYIEIPERCRILVLKNDAELTATETLQLSEALLAAEGIEEVDLNNPFGQEVDSESLGALGTALSKMPKAKKLTLQCQGSKKGAMTDDAASALLATLSSPILTSVVVAGCGFTEKTAYTLAERLSGFTSLVDLNLNANKFSHEGISAITSSLIAIENPTVSELHFGDGKLDPKSIDVIAEFISHPSSIVWSLNLRSSENTYSDRSIARLASAASVGRKLTHLLVDDHDDDDILYNNEMFHLEAFVKRNRLAAAGGDDSLDETSSACNFRDIVTFGEDTCEIDIPERCQIITLQNERLGYAGAKLLSKALSRTSAEVEALDISNTGITGFGADGLISMFKNTRSLKGITMQSNQLDESSGKTISGAILDGIKQGTFNVVSLDLSSNFLSDGGARAFSKVVAKSSSLQLLNLDQNGITAAGLLPLVKKLKTNTVLRSLSLSGAKFDAPSMEALAESMNENVYLTDLSFVPKPWGYSAMYVMEALSRNAAKIEGAHNFFTPFFSVGEDQECSSSEMSMCGFNGCKFRIPKKCVDLNLAVASIGAAEMESFAKKLSTNTKVRILNLSGNAFGDQGALHLADAIKGNGKIQYLSLNQCDIGDAGITAIANILSGTKIHYFHAEANSFGADGYAALFKAMKTSPSLVNVDLNLNSLDDDAAKSIQTVLSTVEGMGRLHQLSVKSHKLSESGLASFTASLSAHFQIGVLDVSLEPGVKHAPEKDGEESYAKVNKRVRTPAFPNPSPAPPRSAFSPFSRTFCCHPP